MGQSVCGRSLLVQRFPLPSLVGRTLVVSLGCADSGQLLLEDEMDAQVKLLMDAAEYRRKDALSFKAEAQELIARATGKEMRYEVLMREAEDFEFAAKLLAQRAMPS